MKKLFGLSLLIVSSLSLSGCDSLGNGMNTSKVRDMNSNRNAMFPSPTPMMTTESNGHMASGEGHMNSNTVNGNMMNSNMHSNSGEMGNGKMMGSNTNRVMDR